MSKSFVVNIDLPYSVQRGEILAVPVVIDNNINEDINVQVTLHNEGHQFEYAEVSNELNATKSNYLFIQ